MSNQSQATGINESPPRSGTMISRWHFNVVSISGASVPLLITTCKAFLSKQETLQVFTMRRSKLRTGLRFLPAVEMTEFKADSW